MSFVRKITPFLLAICMLCTSAAFAEGSYDDPNLNAPGTLPLVKEPITLTVAIASNAAVEDWATNTMTKILEEDTGIHLEFIEIPSDEFVTKMDLQFLSGENLPDVYIHNNFGGQANLVAWGEAGAIIPVNEYYDCFLLGTL